jgi:protein-disulfide isomerase
VVTLALRNSLRATAQAPEAPRQLSIADSAEVWAGGIEIGSTDAPVSLVVFSDLQCPFCARAHSKLDSLLDAQGGRLSIKFRNLPLSAIHPNAELAARMVACVSERGNARSFLSEAFKQQDRLTRTDLIQIAQRLKFAAGLDECVDSSHTAAAIAIDQRVAEKLKIQGTPTFVIGREVIGGMAGVQRVEDILRKAPSIKKLSVR